MRARAPTVRTGGSGALGGCLLIGGTRRKTEPVTMTHRVLHPKPIGSLDEYVEHLAGGTGLTKARGWTPEQVIATIEAAGLRGRGGAGFPTGRKWRTVRENLSPTLPATAIVNAAEGEPGTFKDRMIIQRNPYFVLEGALIAAHVVEAPEVIVAMKRTFASEVERVRSAVAELEAADWTAGVKITVFEGPDEYLYGEETALLEVLDGRMPFPRIAPPFRRGVTEVVETDADADTGSGLSAHVEMAGPSGESDAPPALVDNVETLANIPRIIERGADWFRNDGTAQSPGTLVCTITGSVRSPGVGEVMLGTTLREAITEIGGGPLHGEIVAVAPGVSGALLPASFLDTPLTYEDMAAAGSGLGSGSYFVLDSSIDPVAYVAGATRFLAIESCGQCTPCKVDGLQLSDLLAALARGEATPANLTTLRHRVSTVAVGARCSIGTQQQTLVGGLLSSFGDAVDARLVDDAEPLEPVVVAELLDIDGSSVVIDTRHAAKQPDWTYESTWRGETPVERYTDHRAAP
jgi:NADH:ubiquinone oxidoreductase subunit F (NADH-binding)